MKDDILNAIKKDKIPLFMFRHSGTKMITNIISNVNIIAIVCKPHKAIKHSQNVIDTKSTEATITSQNEILFSTKHCTNRYVLTNSYTDSFINDEGLHTFINGMGL